MAATEPPLEVRGRRSRDEALRPRRHEAHLPPRRLVPRGRRRGAAPARGSRRGPVLLRERPLRRALPRAAEPRHQVPRSPETGGVIKVSVSDGKGGRQSLLSESVYEVQAPKGGVVTLEYQDIQLTADYVRADRRDEGRRGRGGRRPRAGAVPPHGPAARARPHRQDRRPHGREGRARRDLRPRRHPREGRGRGRFAIRDGAVTACEGEDPAWEFRGEGRRRHARRLREAEDGRLPPRRRPAPLHARTSSGPRSATAPRASSSRASATAAGAAAGWACRTTRSSGGRPTRRSRPTSTRRSTSASAPSCGSGRARGRASRACTTPSSTPTRSGSGRRPAPSWPTTSPRGPGPS